MCVFHVMSDGRERQRQGKGTAITVDNWTPRTFTMPHLNLVRPGTGGVYLSVLSVCPLPPLATRTTIAVPPTTHVRCCNAGRHACCAACYMSAEKDKRRRVVKSKTTAALRSNNAAAAGPSPLGASLPRVRSGDVSRPRGGAVHAWRTPTRRSPVRSGAGAAANGGATPPDAGAPLPLLTSPSVHGAAGRLVSCRPAAPLCTVERSIITVQLGTPRVCCARSWREWRAATRW